MACVVWPLAYFGEMQARFITVGYFPKNLFSIRGHDPVVLLLDLVNFSLVTFVIVWTTTGSVHFLSFRFDLATRHTCDLESPEGNLSL